MSLSLATSNSLLGAICFGLLASIRNPEAERRYPCACEFVATQDLLVFRRNRVRITVTRSVRRIARRELSRRKIRAGWSNFRLQFFNLQLKRFLHIYLVSFPHCIRYGLRPH